MWETGVLFVGHIKWGFDGTINSRTRHSRSIAALRISYDAVNWSLAGYEESQNKTQPDCDVRSRGRGSAMHVYCAGCGNHIPGFGT